MRKRAKKKRRKAKRREKPEGKVKPKEEASSNSFFRWLQVSWTAYWQIFCLSTFRFTCNFSFLSCLTVFFRLSFSYLSF